MLLRFWLRRGVDGFRTDASAVLVEDKLLRDDPPNPDANADTPPPQRLKRVFTDDRRESMTYLEEIRQVVDEFDDRVLAAEVQGSTDRIGHFYGHERPRFHLPLNFALLNSPWDALSLQANIDAYLNAIPNKAWPDWVIGGHDKPRVASKIGQAQARILAMLILTLRGTPFLFAGDELGMEQVCIPPDRIQDPFEKLVGGYGLNRDPQRCIRCALFSFSMSYSHSVRCSDLPTGQLFPSIQKKCDSRSVCLLPPLHHCPLSGDRRLGVDVTCHTAFDIDMTLVMTLPPETSVHAKRFALCQKEDDRE
jgi:glycosidase